MVFLFLCSYDVCSRTYISNNKSWSMKNSSHVSCVVLVVKDPPSNAGDARDAGSIPGWGRLLGAGNGNTLQYSCLENSMDKRPCWAAVHRVAKSQT